MLLGSEVLDGVGPLNHPIRQAEQQAPPCQALKREEQQASSLSNSGKRIGFQEI